MFARKYCFISLYLQRKKNDVHCYTKFTFLAFDTSILAPSGDDHCKSSWIISFEPILAADISGEYPFYEIKHKKLNLMYMQKYSPAYICKCVWNSSIL